MVFLLNILYFTYLLRITCYVLTIVFAQSLKIQVHAEITLSEKSLITIIERQDNFFSQSKNRDSSNLSELSRQAQEIVTAYEVHISQNPKDTNALILFGKFLKKVGQEEYAIEYFLKADHINPKIAVVKQQLANYLVENGKPIDAFPYFIQTVDLAPQIAAFHYQLGNFLFLFEQDLVKEGILSKKSSQSFMHRSFRESNKLEPKNFDFALRYAQSFFDYPKSNKENALSVWKKIEEDFPDRSDLELQYFKLCKARILLELNRNKDANALIESVSSKSLQEAKNSLLQRLKNTPNKTQKLEEKLKQSSYIPSHKDFLPSDPHLKKLQKLTSRLIEEKMLMQFQADAVKANYNHVGEIEIEFSENSLKSLDD